MNTPNASTVQFLLMSCPEPNDRDDLITTLSADLGDRRAPAEPLQADAPHYAESDFDLPDPLEALNSARNFQPYLVSGFSRTEKFSVTSVTRHLLFDEDAAFLLLFDVRVEVPQETSESETIIGAFRGRDVFKNLGIDAFALEAFAAAEAHVTDILALSSDRPSSHLIFSYESTLPMVIAGNCDYQQIEIAFCNEERRADVRGRQGIGGEYPNGFFHPGWNYTAALNLPVEVNAALFTVMARMQMGFFSLRFFKQYFETEFLRTYRTRDVGEADVEEADTVRLMYLSFTSRYVKFRSGLFPKYRQELESLEARWSCQADFDALEKFIDLNAQVKDRKHQKRLEQVASRQNQALTLIALIEICAFFGSTKSYLELQAGAPAATIVAGAFVIFVIAYMLIAMRSRILAIVVAFGGLLLVASEVISATDINKLLASLFGQ